MIHARQQFKTLLCVFAPLRETLLFFAIACVALPCLADEMPTLIVPASKIALQVAVPLPEGMTLDQSKRWQLVEVDAPEVIVPVQPIAQLAADGTVAKANGRLCAAIPPRDGATESRRFHLQPVEQATPDRFEWTDLDGKSIKLTAAGQPVLAYNYGLITNESVPQNDHRRSRACYVHPVWGLSGEVMTDDFPRDHYHHHGIFWTWPHIGIDGKQHDLWLGNTIQDRFVGWLGQEAGPVAATLAVENGWFIGDKKVMIERVWLRVFKATDDSRAIDLEFTWIPTDRPITLKGAGGKSYGGLTVRFAPSNRQDTVITVPSGRTTEDLYETPLRWVDFTSKLGGADSPSGAAVFVPSSHPDYPPTWLTRHYGPQCVGWPGIKAKTFQPGEPIRLSYRVWIHKSAVDVEQLREAYDAYLAVEKVHWEE